MEKIKVLIADDMQVIAKSIQKELEKLQEIEVIGLVEDGQQEYDKILEVRPDLVFTDNQMPKMNGIDVIELVENSKIENKPKFVLVTGDPVSELIIKANNLGVLTIINKPIDAYKIERAIEEYKNSKYQVDSEVEEISENRKEQSIWTRLLKKFK